MEKHSNLTVDPRNYNTPKLNGFVGCPHDANRVPLYNRVRDFCHANSVGYLRNVDPATWNDIKQQRNIFVLFGDRIGTFAEWSAVNDFCRSSGRTIHVICDTVLDLTGIDFDCVKFYPCREVLGTMMIEGARSASGTPSRLYNCFIQRVESVRQSWFYFLHDRGLLDRGYVSFLLNQQPDYSPYTGVELYDWIHQHYELYSVPAFDRAYHAMRDRVPFRNFEETGNITSLVLDSKYSLMLDTFATDDDLNQWHYTEKAMIALQTPQIPLMFISRNGHRKLVELGFKIPMPFEHFDHLSWQERQIALLDILTNDSVNINPSTLTEINDYNHGLLRDWQTEYNRPDYFDPIFQQVLNH